MEFVVCILGQAHRNTCWLTHSLPLNSTTSFNLVITVLSLFFFLTKTPMFVMDVFYPPLSVLVHGICVLLYSIAASFQAASDTSDPKHPQNGPPWYITKNCNVASLHTNVNYCKQAKATFALTIVLMFVTSLSLYHTIPYK